MTDTTTYETSHSASVAHGEMEEPAVAKWLFGRSESAWIWLIIRVYVGWQWVSAGWEKLHSAGWASGKSLTGFVTGAIHNTAGAHAAVQGWYGSFLHATVLPNVGFWSALVAWGEFLVGVALIIGLFTGIAAFFGSFMNVNYLLAGAVSTNPILFVLATWLVLAWRVAGWWGCDRWVLPALGTPWRPGRVWHQAS